MNDRQYESKTDFTKHSFENLFRIAVEVEQGGIDFYNAIAQRSKDQRVINELDFLRGAENDYSIQGSDEAHLRGSSTAGS